MAKFAIPATRFLDFLSAATKPTRNTHSLALNALPRCSPTCEKNASQPASANQTRPTRVEFLVLTLFGQLWPATSGGAAHFSRNLLRVTLLQRWIYYSLLWGEVRSIGYLQLLNLYGSSSTMIQRRSFLAVLYNFIPNPDLYFARWEVKLSPRQP